MGNQLASQEVVNHILSFSDDTTLSHHGVLGMKWGVRRAERQIAKGNKKFEKSLNMDTMIKVHNRAAELSNSLDIERINNKPHYKAAADRGDFFDDNKPITQQYHKEHMDAFVARAQQAAKELGTNPSGTREFHAVSDPESFSGFSLGIRDVKHDDENPSVHILMIRDKKGKVTKFGNHPTVAHGMAMTEAILSHHGVLGMKWGVRRAESRSSEVSVSAKPHERRKTTVKTRGGHNLPAHQDAVAAKVIAQKLKKSGTHALSNHDLKTLATRMNLEDQIKRSGAGDSTTTKGIKFADSFNKTPEGKQTVKYAKTAGKRIIGSKHVKRKLATMGVTAAVALS